MLTETLLLDALRRAPRRYRLPPLPATAEEAASEGPASLVAYAIEHAREALGRGGEPAPELRERFTAGLSTLIRAAVRPGTGDTGFQALVLQSRTPEAGAYARLAATHERDRRDARAAVDAIAHPGKLRSMHAGAWRDGLADLHARAASRDWVAVAGALEALAPHAPLAHAPSLERVRAHPAIARLVRATELATTPAVRRYEALRGRDAPRAGSVDAATSGREAKRRGAATEARTLAALEAIAARLDQADPAGPRHRALGGVLVPKGFPCVAARAKNEWDAALVRRAASGDRHDLRLLADPKASPEAAHGDLPRLLRGLQRLAAAEPASVHRFPTRGGFVAVSGELLRRLQPDGSTPPPPVFYSCDAPVARPQGLDAASRAMLLGEPACLGFAGRLLDGVSPGHEELAPVWRAVLQARRLAPVLHQHENARVVREAMLHPDDLLAAFAAPCAA